MPFSGRQRGGDLQQLRRETFDLVVVGAGINGASIARDAALRGYSVALVDAQDFGAGTSSRSSRLIHGGLRYLEHAEFGLVFESVSERAVLARLARHLVRPLRFVLPVHRGDHRGLFIANLGMWLYDLLAVFRNYRGHQRLSAREVLWSLPALRSDGLRGAVAFYDYQTDDARLVLENVLSAVHAGAVALSYAPVEGLELGAPIKTVTIRDLVGHGHHALRARAVIGAAGPWTDRLLDLTGEHQRWLRPTKGVHIVLPRDRLRLDVAMAMQHPFDGRAIFALPYAERSVIGTTDTDFEGDPQQVQATREDVEYLLLAADHYFPQLRLGPDDVISTWSGVRPLLYEDEVQTGAVSREHRITVRGDGLVLIAGGKLTTYRRVAAECVDAVADLIADAGGPLPLPAAPTARRPLPGAIGLTRDEDFDGLVAELAGTFPEPTAQQLAHSYGTRALALVALTRAAPELAEPIVPELPFVWAQVAYGAAEEMALSVSDALIRRTHVLYRDRDQGLGVAARAAEILGQHLGWSAAEGARQVRRYEEEVARNRAWRMPADDGSALILPQPQV